MFFQIHHRGFEDSFFPRGQASKAACPTRLLKSYSPTNTESFLEQWRGSQI